MGWGSSQVLRTVCVARRFQPPSTARSQHPNELTPNGNALPTAMPPRYAYAVPRFSITFEPSSIRRSDRTIVGPISRVSVFQSFTGQRQFERERVVTETGNRKPHAARPYKAPPPPLEFSLNWPTAVQRPPRGQCEHFPYPVVLGWALITSPILPHNT